MVRKIEADLIMAIREGKRFAKQNTTYDPETGDVFLHQNRIFNTKQPGFTLAGWNTVTTRSRVNALLYEFKPDGLRPSVVQRNHSPWLILWDRHSDQRRRYAIGDSEWIPIPETWEGWIVSEIDRETEVDK